MTLGALGVVVGRLNNSVTALGAIGLAIESHLSGCPLPPPVQQQVDAIFAALGVAGDFASADVTELRALLTDIRFGMFDAMKMVSAKPCSPGWMHMESDFLQTTGEASAILPAVIKKLVAPRLAGLAARLESPAAAFVDIGVGVAALSIEMARLWPALRIVGLEPWAPALALARANVEKAGLQDRIELRYQGGEELTETAAFDLAWIPIPFIPERLLEEVLERTAQALRPDGWLLMPFVNPAAEPFVAALSRLRIALWSGSTMTPIEAEVCLQKAGFVDIQTLPTPSVAIAALVACRRP